MKHLFRFEELFEDYSLYLESEDFELENDYSDNFIGRKVLWKGKEYTIIDKHNNSDFVIIDDENRSVIGLDWSDVNLVDDLGESDELFEKKKSGVTASLKKKSKASGIPMGILRKVFAKGMQAWNAGHRPGVAQHQWGMGRVNSFITGAGGARKADADLWAKAKAAKARKKKKK